ncbi:TPA: 50S ribosomal protein L20 [bacterium]|nr:MAG: 50S ribosomal protein L20 [Candidatus Hydrogenedentes bacterium CG1_02_42_14]PIU46795.1 MAG: 50S ribosomal protein L20 [Candidatus Hydrogenedentes bacterium CG07_land_8_20_14_0_80_42_17]HBW47990.1 50S ribosomal protein L20 [bacterium]
MPRAKGASSRQKRKKIFKLAEGMRGGRSKLYKTAKESVIRALSFSFRDRKQNKRVFRTLWIARINAATRESGLSYSRFIAGLKKAGVEVNRKMLSELAIHSKDGMNNLIEISKKALSEGASTLS